LTSVDICFAESSAVERASQPTVIAIFGFEANTPVTKVLGEVLHRELVSQSPAPVQFFSEFMDAGRFEGPPHEARLAASLRERYAGRQVDLLLAPDPLALRFLLKYRDAVFPRVPVVFLDVRAATLSQLVLPSDFVGVAVDVDAEPTVQLALDLSPNATTLVIVTGTSELGRLWGSRLRAAAEKLAPQLDLRVLNELSADEIGRQLASLAPGSVVLGGPFLRDGAGRTFPSVPEVFERWSALSTAPIFQTVELVLGSGVVGGVFVPLELIARQAAEIARTILAGTPAPQVRLPAELTPRPYLDWRQLQRWDIPERRLPADAVVMFREPTLWDRYRYQLIALIAALALQAGLIAALLLQRRWRRQAELSLRAQRIQLLHASRLAVAGELTASIAHEINQPLGAILSNADAVELLLQSGQIHKRELLQIMADIKRDDLRASEVIKRLRALLARHEVEHRRFALHETIRQAMTILTAEARRRSATIDTKLDATAVDLIGDPVQIQQVVINLVLNALDASGDLPQERRRVRVETADVQEGVQLLVRDFGHGIAAADLPRLFESFFSTKSGGMGLGLSIARSIVEAHGGTITAANCEVGAEFRIVLPRATSNNFAGPPLTQSP
jgi:signal transduction histidine kinase